MSCCLLMCNLSGAEWLRLAKYRFFLDQLHTFGCPSGFGCVTPINQLIMQLLSDHQSPSADQNSEELINPGPTRWPGFPVTWWCFGPRMPGPKATPKAKPAAKTKYTIDCQCHGREHQDSTGSWEFFQGGITGILSDHFHNIIGLKWWKKQKPSEMLVLQWAADGSCDSYKLLWLALIITSAHFCFLFFSVCLCISSGVAHGSTDRIRHKWSVSPNLGKHKFNLCRAKSGSTVHVMKGCERCNALYNLHGCTGPSHNQTSTTYIHFSVFWKPL